MISSETLHNTIEGTLCNYCTLIGQSGLHAALPEDEDLPLVICRQGCIGYSRCDSHSGIPSCPHQALPQAIKCLKPNRQEILHGKLKNALHGLEKQNKRLLNKKRQLQERLNRKIVPQNLNSTTLQLQFNEQLEPPSDELNLLQGQIAATKKKIKRLAESQLFFFFWVEMLLSLIALAGTTLQTIYMIQQLWISVGIFALYMTILGVLLLSFLMVIVQQISLRFQDYPDRIVNATILILPFWPLLVFFTVPAITLRRLKNGKRVRKWWFIVAQEFPCNIPINYLIFALKTFVYWMALVVRKTSFTDTFDEATFIMSFFEAISFVFLNLRYNTHRKFIKADKYRE